MRDADSGPAIGTSAQRALYGKLTSRDESPMRHIGRFQVTTEPDAPDDKILEPGLALLRSRNGKTLVSSLDDGQ
jgi:hypothetical protein